MIPHRFARFLGAVLLLAPSLAFGQATLQQPGQGEIIPSAVSKLYGNDLFLQNLIAARFNTLGAAALLNVGAVTGTVADGGALTAEIARARAAEQTNAAAIQTNATAISNETSRAQGIELLKAPIASPAFTGVPTAPTGTTGASSAQVATQAYVVNTIAAGGGGGGGSGGGTGGVPPTRQLNVGGLVQGGGDLTTDRTFTVPAAAQSDVATGTDQTKALTSYSVAAALGAKAPLASPAFVGFPTAPTAPAGTNSTVLATTGFVAGSLGPYAQLASPAFTGSPTAPTPGAADNSTRLATTAYADRSAANAVATAPAMPSGAVSYFAMSSCPATWLAADSTALSRTSYSSLFAAIGTTFGSGDGSTTFNLPDLRGYFLRGFDNGRGVDPGRPFGSYQASQNLAHSHGLANGGSIISTGGPGAYVGSGDYLGVTSIASSGGSEARPQNIALLACIKS